MFAQRLPLERTQLSGWIRFGALIVLALASGYIARVGKNVWPLWVDYPIKVLIGLGIGLILGVAQEKPTAVQRCWRPLRWRVAWYLALSWSIGVVLFLSGCNAWKQEGGWQTFLMVAPILLGVDFLAGRLLTRFRCPHCGDYFFGPKTSLKLASGRNFLLFGLERWPSTHCHNCEWPLWKPIDAQQGH